MGRKNVWRISWHFPAFYRHKSKFAFWMEEEYVSFLGNMTLILQISSLFLTCPSLKGRGNLLHLTKEKPMRGYKTSF
jgi:hypothetical protein